MTDVQIKRELLERLLYSNSPARFDATEYNAARAELFATLAQPAQQGEAVEAVGWRRLDRPYELTAYPSVCAMWHGNGWPVQELYTHPAASVPAGCKVVPVELLERAVYNMELAEMDGPTCRELRALLASAEVVKDE